MLKHVETIKQRKCFAAFFTCDNYSSSCGSNHGTKEMFCCLLFFLGCEEG